MHASQIILHTAPSELLTYTSLKQGVGKLHLVGPPGFQGLLDSMAVFTNKKYPEQCVVEVGRADGTGDHRKDVTIDLDYMTVLVRPVFVSQV